MVNTVVSARSLTRLYGSTAAAKDLTFDINQGEIFGLIGPDGAGKTTTFHMMGGILRQSGGELQVLGKSAREARLEIGYLTQTFSLYQDLSIEENIAYAAGLRAVEPVDFQERKQRYLRLMDLERFAGRLAGNLSGGMKQKLALCCALIGRPKLLLLDEPTTGVDPVSRRDFWDILAAIATEGVTVAVATPYLDEAERCTRIALMYKGQIQEIGTPSQLKTGVGMKRLEVRGASLDSMQALISASTNASSIADIQAFGDRLDVLTRDAARVHEQILQASAENRAGLSISEQDPTLENVFSLRLQSLNPASETQPFPFVTSDLNKEEAAIDAHQLVKTFGSFTAVKNVSIHIPYGKIFGLLGANGAGKTTAIKMLCGLLEPTAGRISLAGRTRDLRELALRQKLGYMSQKFTLYQDLTVMENLRFYAGVYQVPPRLENERINWVINSCGLKGSENHLAEELPGGFRQRLSFGATVLHQPSILFLDEPTSGVDPLARRELWSLISQFAHEGTAVLVTTHFLEEAEYCHSLGFMVAGEMVAQGAPQQIKDEQPGILLEIKTDNNHSATTELRKQLASWRVSIFADSLHVVADNENHARQLVERLTSHGINVEAARRIPFSLEDAFIGIVERRQKELAA